MKEDKKPLRTISDLINEHANIEIEGEVVSDLDLNLIQTNPNQPRKVFDEQKIAELAQSIKENGVFQPIIVKQVGKNYVIVAGERRFRAAKIAGLSTIPTIIRAYREDKAVEIALLENLQREDLTAIEEAYAYDNLMKHLKLTQVQLAERVSKSRAHITNILGLLVLPDSVKELVLNRKLSMGHARALSKLDSAKKIEELAQRVCSEDLSVRQIEKHTQNLEKKTPIKRQPKPDTHILYEKLLESKYQTKASLSDKKLILTFKDEKALKKLLEVLVDE